MKSSRCIFAVSHPTRELYDFRHLDRNKVGLQYVDFEFDGDDIIYL